MINIDLSLNKLKFLTGTKKFMLFHSFEFLTLFISTLLLTFLFRSNPWRKRIIILVSFIFYSWDYLDYLILPIYSSLLDYFVGKKIFNHRHQRRRFWLVVSLLGNLGALVTFKYLGYFNSLLQWLTPQWDWQFQVLLPIGISFYTFQTMSYSIDIYRGKIKPCRRLEDFILYVVFFPQLIAGPIVRAAEFLPQIKKRFSFNSEQVVSGCHLFIFGLFKKTLGDTLYLAHREVTTYTSDYGGGWVALAFYAMTFHIYLDFSGYSDMAIGLARCFGISFPENFRWPFLAASFGDLWRRWHITLSSWMRDYLYISLGGNRCGPWRHKFNLMLTMALSGLWHGASTNFILWGVFHGFFLLIEKTRLWRAVFRFRTLSCLVVFHITVILFVLFTVETPWELKRLFLALFSETKGPVTPYLAWATLVLVVIFLVHVITFINENFWEKWTSRPYLQRIAFMGALFFVLIFSVRTPFIYFRF